MGDRETPQEQNEEDYQSENNENDNNQESYDNESEEFDENSDGDEEEYANDRPEIIMTARENPFASLEATDTADDTAAVEIFDEVQKNMQVLAGLSTSEDMVKAIEKLSAEYQRMNNLFLESRRQTRTVAKKAGEMAQELTENGVKVQSILKMNQTDRQMISSMRKELKKAWKCVEQNAEKEEKTKEIISSLKNELMATKMAISDGAAVSETGGLGRNKLLALQFEQEEHLKRLTKAKNEMESELANSGNEIKSLKADLEQAQFRIDSLIKERLYMDEEMLSLKEYLTAKKSEHDREVRTREKVEQSLRIALENSEKKETELKLKTEEIKNHRETILKSDLMFQNEKSRADRLEQDMDITHSQHIRLQTDHDEVTTLYQVLLNKSQDQNRKLKQWEEEISRLRENYKTVTKSKQALVKKYKVLEEAKMGSEMERDSLRSINSHLLHDLDTTKKELEQATKNCDMLTRERDISQKNFVKSTSASLKQYNVLKLSEQNKRNLEQEISAYKDEAQKMRKLIYSLEKERDNKMNDVSHLNQLLDARDEEVKMKDVMIFDAKKKITEFEKKSKEQQALYENVRTDRNVYSKNLLESQDEIMEMKRKLKIMNHQIEQLKEEITSRETVLVKEHFEHSKLEKEKEALLLQIGKLQQQHEESTHMIQNQESEENKLRHIIMEADMERIRQKKEYDAVVQERIKIQTSTLNKGEIQYRERLEDIRVLRLEIKKLRREKAILQTETQNVESLRNEIFRLQRDILRERTRVKVLEEELESPMNIHRWRKLAGSDPSTFELISKIQTLQKRLITKTEEVVEKELIIQQKEKLYNDVKKVLQRQPGPEIMEELQTVRGAALASELNMYHSQVNEYKYEIERLNREMQELKGKYYQLRKKLQTEKRTKEASREVDLFGLYDGATPYPGHEALPILPGRGTTTMRLESSSKVFKPNMVSGPRFSGGGFNMSAGHHFIQTEPLVPPAAVEDPPKVDDSIVLQDVDNLSTQPIVEFKQLDAERLIEEGKEASVSIPVVKSEEVISFEIHESSEQPVVSEDSKPLDQAEMEISTPQQDVNEKQDWTMDDNEETPAEFTGSKENVLADEPVEATEDEY
ncbi:hypothetical protein BC833DRAFT_567573 [Globomyces pollinis-pini]|nr:hypothetical protein BC833DRAFT_567573 [Globomyces pollinis-pini]